MGKRQIVDIAFNDEQRQFRAAIRAFCAEAAARRAGSHVPFDAEERLHDSDLYKCLGELGWIGVAVPEEYGGGGGSLVDMCIVLEETARGRLPLEGFQVSLIVAGVLQRYGTEQQKSKVLKAITTGRVAAIAMSEPDAGSDLGAISCRITSDDGGFVIDGQKTWTSAAHIADHIIVVGRSAEHRSDDSRFSGLTMLLIPSTAPGLVISPIDTMGGHEVNELYFTECRTPVDSLVGLVGKAWTQLISGLNHERLIVAAQALGMAEGSLDQVLDYVGTREQFGRRIGTFQALAHRIADLATEIEATRALVYALAQTMTDDPTAELPAEAAMAKLKATELCKRAALEGMQMMGGLGYARESGMEEQVRRALKMTIGGGTSEIQRDVIAKSLKIGAPR